MRFINSIFFLIFVFPTLSFSDVSWALKARSCEDFSNGVIDFYNSIEDLNNLTEVKKAEIGLIIEVSCLSRFINCGFSLCKKESEDTKVIKTFIGKSEEKGVSMPSWLNTGMSCGELKDQIRARYLPLGGAWKNLPKVSKDELGVVLKIACGKEFSHCGFKRCKDFNAKNKKRELDKLKKKLEESKNKKISTEEEYISSLIEATKAIRQFREDVRIFKLSQDLEIKKITKKERKEGIKWNLFSTPIGLKK